MRRAQLIVILVCCIGAIVELSAPIHSPINARKQPKSTADVVEGAALITTSIKSVAAEAHLPLPWKHSFEELFTAPEIHNLVPFSELIHFQNNNSSTIFSDFTAFQHPSAHQLVHGEGVVLTDVPPQPPRDAFGVPSSEFPCIYPPKSTYFPPFSNSVETVFAPSLSNEAQSANSSVISIYIPWRGGVGFSAQIIPCPMSCKFVDDPAVFRLSSPKVDAYVVDTNGALVNEPYDWVRNPLGLRLIAVNTENIKGRRKELRKGYGIRYLAKPWNESFWNYFDLVVSYESASTIPLNYCGWALCREPFAEQQRAQMRRSFSVTKNISLVGVESQNEFLYAFKKNRAVPVLYFSRNCEFVAVRRNGFVRELMRHMRVHAVGKCLHNFEQENVHGCNSAPRKNRRLCIIAQYTFYLSLENSISLDYVTEKIFEPLAVGTIPIYIGAPNVENFLPTSHSAILAADFRSVEELSKYLMCLLKKPHLLRHYQSWWDRPKFVSWTRQAQRFSPLCEVCLRLHKNMTVPRGTGAPAVIAGIYRENFGKQKPFDECL